MFVVYNKHSTLIIDTKGNASERAYHETERAAKGARTRARKVVNVFEGANLEIADTATFYESIEKTVTVRNVMTGALVEERANTPYSCSVASEAYFCS